MSTGNLKKKGPPPIVKMDKALKLAEQWVNNMTKTDDEPSQSETEDRPYKLGLGAKVSKQIKRGPSDDPIEQTLQAKLEAGKRKMARIAAESMASANTAGNSDSESDEESESKSRAFGKKTLPSASSLQAKK